VALDRSWADAEEFQAELVAHDCLALEADVTDDGALDAAYSEVIGRFGTVDVLVNNAGLVSETLFAPHGHVKLLDTQDSDWETMFGVNVFGTVKVIRRFTRPMTESGHGSVVSIVSSGILTSSTGGGYFGARPWSVEMPYQASKSALATLSFYLAQETFHLGLAVNSVMPGHTRASWFDDTARAFHEDGGSVYFMRPLVPEHMVPIMLFLSSQAVAREGQRAVTGRLFHVPDWNYDHGYGDYRLWLDHNLPDELEVGYRRLESVLPDYWRAGLARAPFDVERVVFASGLDRLSALERDAGDS
jgi:NAD(P)-dependent dehydrogenase (short-subunit alcohol dehydrogenase family)